MLNFRQFEAVEDKVKIASSKVLSRNIKETLSWPLSFESFHDRAPHRAKK